MTRTIGIDIRVLGSGRVSGIEEYTRQLLAHMIPLDSTIQFALYSSGGTKPMPQPWMEAPSVRWVHDTVSNRFQFVRTRLTGRPYVDVRLGGVDCMFFPHFLLGATSPQMPRVMTWHDLSYELLPDTLSWRRRVWHQLQMCSRWQARTANQLIAVSQATADDLARWYAIPASRISVVPSGVDPLLMRPSDAAIAAYRRERGLPERFLLALGTREPRKNLDALVAAWERVRRTVPDVGLVIAGAPAWHDAASARARAQGAVVWDAISMEERALLYASAEVLVYPSLMEGFGFPPLEAMACGTPVVASANSSIAEVVADAGLLVSPYSIDALGDALTAVLLDAELRALLVNRGARRVQLFDWRTAASRTLEVLTRAMR